MLLRLLFAPLVLLLRLIAAPLRALRRARAAPPGALVELRVRGHVREGPPRPRKVWPPRLLVRRERPAEVRVLVVRKLVDELLRDPRPGGLVVSIEPLSGGWAALEALRVELSRVRAAGKRLVAWLPEGGGNRELYVASCADTIVAPPSVDLALVGPKAEAHYARRALDKLGIDVELHARKEFKSAGDRLAKDGRSEADRLQTEALLDAIERALVAAVAEGRRVPEERVRAWIDGGPGHAARFVELGLIDRLAHDDDLPTVLAARVVPAAAYAARRGIGRRPLRLRAPRVIGVVEVHGAITGRTTPLAEAMGQVAVADRVVADLRAAERDPRVAAVVLDVDSPGGTVTASDAIWSAARRLAEKKPVVARMGDVAASGGYWIAVAAKTIVARPLTITGSIGVVAMRPIASRLAERLGIARDVITRGRYADLDAVTRAPTDDERALFAREVDAHYASFVSHVARARARSEDQIDEVARGRVWTGHDAQARGLVDRLGGIDVALEVLRAELGAVAVHPDPVVVVGRAPSRRDPAPRAASVLAALAELLPASSRRALTPIVASIEAGARVAAIADLDVG